MRQREIEEQMRRTREESYRMGGFMDNVSNAFRKLLAFNYNVGEILSSKIFSSFFYYLFFFAEREGDENES